MLKQKVYYLPYILSYSTVLTALSGWFTNQSYNLYIAPLPVSWVLNLSNLEGWETESTSSWLPEPGIEFTVPHRQPPVFSSANYIWEGSKFGWDLGLLYNKIA